MGGDLAVAGTVAEIVLGPGHARRHHRGMLRAAVIACLFLIAPGALGAVEGGQRRSRPWEPHIAALTDPRPAVADPAIEALVRFGEPALADTAVLAADADWRVRGRVATVAAGIGGPAGSALLLTISRDPEPRVRELAALGLGLCRFPGVYQRLAELLDDRLPVVRSAAARGLSSLADPRALARLADPRGESDATVRATRRSALATLVLAPATVPHLAEQLGVARGEALHALTEVSGLTGDTRLSPALARLLAGDDRRAAQLAARSLAACGDSLALEALCAAAAGAHRELAREAAATLRDLTGYSAAPGAAWGLWWRDHGAEVAGLAERDRFVAALHDPDLPVSRADLARFTPDQLAPLLEGCLGLGAPWWPARAYGVLRLDDAARWTAPLLARIAKVADPDERLALIILLDQFGDPAALAGLRELRAANLAAEHKRRATSRARNNPERLALDIAIERRGGTVASADAVLPWR